VFEVLLVVIGVLVLIGLLLMGRSRRGDSDPSSSVDAFHRALSAMEPGAGDQQGHDGATDAEDPAVEDAGDPEAAPDQQRDGSST
jgi:hypothetical protein